MTTDLTIGRSYREEIEELERLLPLYPEATDIRRHRRIVHKLRGLRAAEALRTGA